MQSDVEGVPSGQAGAEKTSECVARCRGVDGGHGKGVEGGTSVGSDKNGPCRGEGDEGGARTPVNEPLAGRDGAGDIRDLNPRYRRGLDFVRGGDINAGPHLDRKGGDGGGSRIEHGNQAGGTGELDGLQHHRRGHLQLR